MITLGGILSPRLGYGSTLFNLERALESFGHDTKILPLQVDESDAAIPGRTRRKVTDHVEGVGILIAPPDLVDERFDVQLTMWEVPLLPAHMVHRLNQKRLILTPSQWCRHNFITSGVTTEIKIVPLCIDTLQFPEILIPETDVHAWFGCTHDRCTDRYHNDLVVDAFLQEFGADDNVKLRIRGSGPPRVGNRIDTISHYLSPVELAAWYRSLTILVSPSSGEGWSLVNHEAMCSGRAVASLGVTGEAEYMPEECMYRLDYTMKPAAGIYSGQDWPVPTVESIRRVLRAVYEDRQEARLKGQLAARAARKFNEEISVLRLIEAI